MARRASKRDAIGFWAAHVASIVIVTHASARKTNGAAFLQDQSYIRGF